MSFVYAIRKGLPSLLLFICCNATRSQTVYYSKSTGNLNTLSTWGTNADGSGTQPANFTGVNCTYIITNQTLATIGAAWTVGGVGSFVQVGLGSPVEFSIPTGFAFSGSISVASSATLTILNTTIPTMATLSAGSSVNYARAGNQTVANADYYNLFLAGSGLKSFANTVSASVSNSLLIASGVTMRLHTVSTLLATISGSIFGSGAIVGNGNSNLAVTGSGDFGTLTFTTTLTLRQLQVNRVNGIVQLGSNLTVSTDFNHAAGTLDLNGNLLTLNGAITFPFAAGDGSFVGSATSSITIGASTNAIANTFFISQSSSASKKLSRFSINRVNQTIMLGTDLVVADNFVLTNGIINLNNQSLSVGGIVAFPTATTNGYIIGSANASLTVNGAGTISNALRLDQSSASSRTLRSFLIDHTGGTLTFGSDIICDAAFTHSNGPVSLGATSLTLNGSVVFPASATNGSFTGSASSSLSIAGSGTIGGQLFMTQTSAAARTFNSFSIDRPGATLLLGNAVTVNEFAQTNATISLNGALLTINGTALLPATTSNGLFVGSATSSLTIGTSTNAVTNALTFDQSSLSARSLSRFSMDRASQTLTLGGDMAVTDNFVQTNGNISLNGRALTVGGIIIFPVAAANGVLISSASSSLTINGAGAISNALRFDQTSASSRTLRSLVVDHAGGTLTFGTDIICDAVFTHSNGPITLGATSLTLNGDVSFPASASNGSFTGSASSSLSIQGSGSLGGQLFMAQSSAAARTFNSFSLNRVGATLMLGNAVIVNEYSQAKGTIDLNGALLTLNGTILLPATAADGKFVGSATSSITIGTSANGITNPLFFDQSASASRSLSRLGLNRASQTLQLGTDLTVIDNFVHTNGIIDLNSHALSVGGIITFPAAVGNGVFIGSSSSSLTINGAGAITNSLKLDQTSSSSRTLRSFVIDHTGGTLTFGSNIICGAAFTHSNGPVTLGATSLSINGDIVFPSSAANGSITGSATSSLSIAGSGSISGNLYMSQATAAARTLNYFSFDRATTTVNAGNDLTINTYSHVNGFVGLNGNLLSINAAATLPAALSNGGFIGSLTSSLSVTGAGAITNSLRFTQGNSVEYSLSSLTLARAGQMLSVSTPLEIRNAMTPTSGTLATNGNVTLKADGSRSGMIGVVGGVLTGNVKVETYAPAGNTGWAHLGPTGVTGLTVANWESQFPMTCYGCPHDENSAGGFFVSIQRYNEAASGNAAYVPMSYTDALSRGIGYWVYLGLGTSTTSAVTYSVNGPPVTGNVTIPVTNSANSGYNLVSNPYAAPVDWDLISADASNILISPTVYFYNADIAQTITYVGGVSSPSGYIANGVIPAGQGFYVQALSGTSITFRESHKSTANTNANPLLRQETITPANVFRVALRSGHSLDETVIRIHDSATFGFDRKLDAVKVYELPGLPPQRRTRGFGIATRWGVNDYAINAIPPVRQELRMPLVIRAAAGSTISIAAESRVPGGCLVLKDNLLGKQHNLGEGPYECTFTPDSAAKRFEIILCENSGHAPGGTAGNMTISGFSSDGIMHVQFAPQTQREAMVSVYDVAGSCLVNSFIVKRGVNEQQIELPPSATGIGIVEVKDGDRSFHFKTPLR